MDLKDYSTEELRAEIKRRYELEQEAKKRELRCRNCKHVINYPKGTRMYVCGVRTWGKTYQRHYSIKLYTKACDKFESKQENVIQNYE